MSANGSKPPEPGAGIFLLLSGLRSDRTLLGAGQASGPLGEARTIAALETAVANALLVVRAAQLAEYFNASGYCL